MQQPRLLTHRLADGLWRLPLACCYLERPFADRTENGDRALGGAVPGLLREPDCVGVDGRYVFAEAAGLEYVAARRKRVGDDDFGPRTDEVLVDLPHGVGVGQHGLAAPHLAVHGNANLLELGPHTTIADNDIASTVQAIFQPIGLRRHWAVPIKPRLVSTGYGVRGARIGVSRSARSAMRSRCGYRSPPW